MEAGDDADGRTVEERFGAGDSDDRVRALGICHAADFSDLKFTSGCGAEFCDDLVKCRTIVGGSHAC